MSQHKKEVERQREIEKSIPDSEEEKPLSASEEKAAAKERAKPKEYTVESFNTPLNKDEKEAFGDLKDEDEKKKFIIRRWMQENNHLDKVDQHEISLEDMRLIGAMPPAE